MKTGSMSEVRKHLPAGLQLREQGAVIPGTDKSGKYTAYLQTAAMLPHATLRQTNEGTKIEGPHLELVCTSPDNLKRAMQAIRSTAHRDKKGGHRFRGVRWVQRTLTSNGGGKPKYVVYLFHAKEGA